MINSGMTKKELLDEIILQVRSDINELNDAVKAYDGEDMVKKANMEGIVGGYLQALNKLCTFTSLI